jgi:protein-tyrosine phosphatase
MQPSISEALIMMKLKTLSAALLLAPLSLSLATLSFGFPAQVERTADDKLQLSWNNGAMPVDVWVEYRAHGTGSERKLLSKQDADGKHELAAEVERPYFILVAADGSEQEVAERLLPLEGGNNFRDLGGYDTEDGRTVKWGTLYRSGTMVGLTANDYAYLDQLGIRTVCDFRSTEERTNEPTQWQGAHQPKRWETDYEMNTSSMMQEIMKPGMTAAQAKQVFATFYRDVPFEFSKQYREMFAELTAGHAPLAFNCSAGKDRTGVASALLLRALGVKREQIIADYQLSSRYFKPPQPKPGAQDATSQLLANLSPEIIQVLMGTEPAYIEAAFAGIEERHGSFETYLESELGVDAAGLAKLRELYTE